MKDNSWETSYYNETNRAKRKILLDQAIAEEGMTKENELRLKLYEARYADSEKSGREIDLFIRGWMTMEYMKATSKNRFLGGKKIKKEKDFLFRDWQYDLVQSYGEIGEDIIYKEYCQLTRLYLELCEKDHTYGSVMLGMGRMKYSSFLQKISDDIFRVAYIIPRVMGAEEELRLFTKAASYQFCMQYPDLTDAFYARVKEHLEKKQ